MLRCHGAAESVWRFIASSDVICDANSAIIVSLEVVYGNSTVIVVGTLWLDVRSITIQYIIYMSSTHIQDQITG